MKITKILDYGLVFDDGTKMEDYHEQDCCEAVYADWKQLRDTTIMSEDFDKLEIEVVPDAGFRLNKYFVPCYNAQNGYYSSNLVIKINYADGKKESVDITGGTEYRER